MRIAWLHSHFFYWAGGTKFVYEVARRMQKTVTVDMFVEGCSPEIREMYEKENMRVVTLGSVSSPSYGYWLFFPHYAERDIQKMREFKDQYDLFITSMFPMNYVAWKACLKPFMSYVFEPFTFFHDPDMIAGFPLLKRIALGTLGGLYKSWDVKSIQAADKLMTINDGTREWTRKIYGKDSAPSFLGVDTDFFSPKEENPLNARYKGRTVVVHSTDFTPLKKTWDAVRVIESIKNEIPEVKLVITYTSDNPAERTRIQNYLTARRLNDHVEFAGFVPHRELPYYYSRADVSLYTGIGSGASAASLFVLECMACGTPGVRTRYTDDEIVHHASGFLYDPGDSAALKNYLVTLLANEPLRCQFGEAARKRILDYYSWDGVVERFLRNIQALESAPSGRSR